MVGVQQITCFMLLHGLCCVKTSVLVSIEMKHVAGQPGLNLMQ